MRERLICVDAGGTMTKAALFDMEGRELACERRANQMLFPAPGHTERDPDRMWNAACEAIASLFEQTGVAPEDIAAVSAAGYGSGLYLVDRAGDPVRPGIVSTDSRAADLVTEWTRSGLAGEIAAAIGQRVWPGQSLSLIAWLDRNEPGLLARTHSVLFCKDFLRARLCGDISTDPTDAGIAGLIDITAERYAEGALAALGLKGWADRMPPIRPVCEVAGRIGETAAKRTGLKAGTPVVRGAVDVTASALASGVVEASQLSIVAGTFSINSTLHRRPRTSTPPFLQSAYPIGGAYLATEGAATSASNLEWFVKQLLDAEGARAALSGRSVYDVCNELVAGALDGPNDILFFPFLFGGPAGAPAGFLGMTAGHSLADMLRAIYEGIAFAHRQDIDVLLSGPDAARPTTVRLAGGASRSMVWAQIFADALAMPVEIMQGSELGAQGVAMCAGTAIGAYPDLATAAGAMTRTVRRFEPNVARVEALAAKFQRYKAVSAVLGEAWSAPRADAALTARAA